MQRRLCRRSVCHPVLHRSPRLRATGLFRGGRVGGLRRSQNVLGSYMEVTMSVRRKLIGIMALLIALWLGPSREAAASGNIGCVSDQCPNASYCNGDFAAGGS